MTHRDRQVICGLFLSKYNREGLRHLGFTSYAEAFNAMGYGLKANPASIKNYRDELDPCFPNDRKGWHQRPLRDHCQRILSEYGNASIDELGECIKRFLMPGDGIESFPEVARLVSTRKHGAESSFAKRLITGLAAEQYFSSHYQSMPEFHGREMTDTTRWGCGFDFKLTTPLEGSFLAVEVKGLREKNGQIQMTELEHEIASALKERYYLVLIRNFAERPFHTVVNNPLDSDMRFRMIEKVEVRHTWATTIC